MVMVPTTVFFSIGLGAVFVTIIAVLAALTMVPAILSLMGDRVNAWKLPFVPFADGTHDDDTGGFWNAITRLVMGHPWPALIIVGGLLIAATIPYFDIKTGAAGIDTLPQEFRSLQAFSVLRDEFPGQVGGISAANIVIDGDVTNPEVQAGIERPLGFGFLGLLIGITSVLFSVLRNAREASSQRALSGVLALLGLAGVGVAGFIGLVGAVGLFLATTFVQHGPVRSIEILHAGARPISYGSWDDAGDDYAASLEDEATAAYQRQLGSEEVLDPRYPLHVLVEFEGDVHEGRLERWLRRETHGEVALLGTRVFLEDGRERTLIHFGLDVDHGDLEDFRDEVELLLPFLDVPDGVRIQIRRP